MLLLVSEGCSFFNHAEVFGFSHNYGYATTYNIQSNVFKASSPVGEKISKGAINIQDDVWIGSNSVYYRG